MQLGLFKSLNRRKPSEGGATLVEFAVVAPLLFLLLFGTIEFGRAIATFTGVTTAAREGARFGTTVGESDAGLSRYLDCDAIRDAAKAKAVLVTLNDADIDITYDTGPGTSVVADCQGGTAPTADLVASNSRVVVEVRTTFTSPVPVISSIVGNMDIGSTQSRTIFTGVVE